MDVSADVDVTGVHALVEMLGMVADPRKPRGVRHRIGAVLAVTVFAALAGPAVSGKRGTARRTCRRSCWRWPGAVDML